MLKILLGNKPQLPGVAAARGHGELVIGAVVDDVETFVRTSELRRQLEVTVASRGDGPQLPGVAAARGHGELVIGAVVDDVETFVRTSELRRQLRMRPT